MPLGVNKGILEVVMVNSFFERFIGLFFEPAERIIKPIMYAQITLCIGVICTWFLASYYPALNTAAIMYLILGTYFLLTSMEAFMIYGKQRKGFIIWFTCSLLFYWTAFDLYFLS